VWQLAVDEPAPFELLSPRSIDEAVDLSARHGFDSALMAGGTDLLDQLKQHRRTPRFVINLKTIRDLRKLTVSGERVSIGALTTIGDLERHVELNRLCPALTKAASRVATPQIRNVGTIGGNLLQDSRCPYYRGPWYCYRAGGIQCDARHGVNQEHAIFGGNRCYTVSPSDTAPALIALGATATIHGPAPRQVSLEDLFMPPAENITSMHRVTHGQILSEVTVPIRAGVRSTFIKYAMRNSWDFAIASVAVALRLDSGLARDARIVIGGVAPIPWRSQDAEREIDGKRLDRTTIEAAARAAIAGARPLAQNEYKIAVVKKLVRTALMELAQ
jgi:xanthine dehydrogenase YagS FAD-binding subunit